MDKQESYGRKNLFVYCKDTCDPRGLYYAKNEVDKVIDDMMAESSTDSRTSSDASRRQTKSECSAHGSRMENRI